MGRWLKGIVTVVYAPAPYQIFCNLITLDLANREQPFDTGHRFRLL